jgi:excinuclease ABC subunit B
VITAEYLNELEAEMMAAADALEFERAASLRDRITQLRDEVGKDIRDVAPSGGKGRGNSRGRGQRSRVPRPKKQ